MTSKDIVSIPSTVAEILAMPPIKWREQSESPAPSDDDLYRSGLADDLTAGLVRLARARGYFNARSAGYDHNEAVKASNRHAEVVRKLCGFTYPKDNISF